MVTLSGFQPCIVLEKKDKFQHFKSRILHQVKGKGVLYVFQREMGEEVEVVKPY